MALHRGDGDVAPGGNGGGGLNGFLDRIIQVQLAGHQQRLGLDGGQRPHRIAAERGLAVHRGVADVVPVIGPGLRDPVIGVEAGPDHHILLRLDPGQHVHRCGELLTHRLRRAGGEHLQHVGAHSPAAGRLRGVVTALERWVEHESASGSVVDGNGPGGGARHRRQRDQAVHHAWVAHAPLQRLHPAHRRAGDGNQMPHAEVVQQTALTFHHVAQGKVRERRAMLRRAGARRRGDAIANGVGADDEQVVGVQPFARPDQVVDPMMVAADGGHHQHSIGLGGVQRAGGHVSDAEVADHLPAFQRQVADAVSFQARLGRRLGVGRSVGDQERHHKRQPGHSHRRVPTLVHWPGRYWPPAEPVNAGHQGRRQGRALCSSSSRTRWAAAIRADCDTRPVTASAIRCSAQTTVRTSPCLE